MKVLAIDSSGLVASVAVTEDDILLGEYSVNYKKTHSQTLLPMLDEVARMIELDLENVDVIAVSAGPGSFTGLRIGSATAKGLGLALRKKIVSVPTVDALAWNLWGTDRVVCPLMDARRQQAYTGLYEFVTDGEETEQKQNADNCGTDAESARIITGMHVILPQCAVGVEEILEKVNELGRPVVFLGDGVPVFREAIQTGCRVPYIFAPAHQNRQRAASVAVLGARLFAEGKAEPAGEHRPEYLRLSQAERERMEKEKDFCIC